MPSCVIGLLWIDENCVGSGEVQGSVVVARTLAAVRSHSQVGVCLKELDDLAHGFISDAGARPSFLNYHPSFGPSPFPGVICTSVSGGRL